MNLTLAVIIINGEPSRDFISIGTVEPTSQECIPRRNQSDQTYYHVVNSSDRNIGGSRSKGNTAFVEGPDRNSWQGSPEDYGRLRALGFADAIHRHNAHVFVYILEGSVVMQVRGGKEVTLAPGQTFYEGPQDVHVVGRNASKTKPAKFLALFVKDKGAPSLIPGK